MKIFFPPRIIDTDLQTGNVSAALDHAVSLYTDASVAILLHEESLRDALKIVNFAAGFPNLSPPPLGDAG